MTDVVGILNGPLTITNVTNTVLGLHGDATTNLRVEAPYRVTIDSHTFDKGSYFDTGLDASGDGIELHATGDLHIRHTGSIAAEPANSPCAHGVSGSQADRSCLGTTRFAGWIQSAEPWTAPYLHDGGVAVGRNIATELGCLEQ